ncbi:MAG: hypothetical protein ABI072_04245 [Edaphobacter sp.]
MANNKNPGSRSPKPSAQAGSNPPQASAQTAAETAAQTATKAAAQTAAQAAVQTATQSAPQMAPQTSAKLTRRAGSGPNLTRAVAPPELNDSDSRIRWGLPSSESELGWYMVELNLMHNGGLVDAGTKFLALHALIVGPEQMTADPPVPISKTYFRSSSA